MIEAALWGALGASSLVVAAEVAFVVRMPRLLIGLIMAFGVGALISSVAFELVEPALSSSDLWQVGLGLAGGSLVFFVGDRAIERLGHRRRAAPGAPGDARGRGGESDGDDPDDGDAGGGGLGIVLGTVLDGIPESAVLGMSLVGGGGVSVSLLAGIWVSNFPEALGSTVNMGLAGWSRTAIRALWWSVTVVSAAAAGIGYAVVDGSGTLDGAIIEAFAAGALLTMIADGMAPEAFERSRSYAGLATVAGFAVAIALSSVG